MEKDDEIDGVTGSKLDFGARMYDSRIGKFLSVDPLIGNFPSFSSYQYANNSPIYYIDNEGESGVAYKTDKKNKDGKPILRVVSNIFIYGEGATDANAKTIQANASAQFNNNGEFFTATVDGVEYEVQFEFETKIIDGKDVDGKLIEGGYGNLNAENNFYEIVNEPKKEGNVGNTLTGRAEGSGGNAGFIKTSEVGTPTVSHELNHGFGGEDKDTKTVVSTTDNDIAVQSQNSSNPAERKVTQGNIDAIFKNVSFEKGSNKANVGNPRPDLYDNTTGESKRVTPK